MKDYQDGRQSLPGTLKPEVHRRHSAVDYLVRTYSGSAAFMDVAMEIREMLDDGLTVSNDLIDHLFKTHQRAHLRRFAAPREGEPAPVPRVPLESFVYFIRHGDTVKIGVSTDPGKRAAALSLRESNVLAVLPGDRKLERSLHAKFAAHRIGTTEWFAICPEIIDYIDTYAERFTKHHRSRKGRTSEVSDPYENLARTIIRGTP